MKGFGFFAGNTNSLFRKFVRIIINLQSKKLAFVCPIICTSCFLNRFGADTEDIARIRAGLPGFPITITATYHHLKVFTFLN